MNRQKAQEIMKAYGRPVFRIKDSDKTISFARQSLKDIETIEQMSDEDLIQEWKCLVWMNEIYEMVSLNDMQRISLFELEMQSRTSIDRGELEVWYTKAEDEQRMKEENDDNDYLHQTQEPF